MPEWYTSSMATVHRRIQVTPDDELVAALDRAATVWPGASRSDLVRRLALAGDRSGLEEQARRVAGRRGAIHELRALAGDAGTADEREQLRAEWRR